MFSKNRVFIAFIIALMLIVSSHAQDENFDPVTIKSEEGWTFEVVSITATSEIDETDFESDNGMYVILSGVIHNTGGTVNCINPRNFKLKIGDISFRVLQEEGRHLQSFLGTVTVMIQGENYCAGADSIEILAAVFDVPAKSESAEFTLFETTEPLAMEWDLEQSASYRFESETLDNNQ